MIYKRTTRTRTQIRKTVIALPLVLIFSFNAPLNKMVNQAPAGLLFTEIQDPEWMDLFDGQTLNGWQSVQRDHDPSEGWHVQDGELILDRPGYGSDLMTLMKYSNFDLIMNFKLSEGCNSGLKYFVDEFDYQGTKSIVGLEFQLIDDDLAQDVSDPTHRMAALFDLIAPDTTTRLMHPPDEWNELRIVSDGGHVEHWLNGKKVVVFNRYEENFKKLIAESKYRNWTGFGLISEGHILLQDHGSRVSFRNIRIKTWNSP